MSETNLDPEFYSDPDLRLLDPEQALEAIRVRSSLDDPDNDTRQVLTSLVNAGMLVCAVRKSDGELVFKRVPGSEDLWVQFEKETL